MQGLKKPNGELNKEETGHIQMSWWAWRVEETMIIPVGVRRRMNVDWIGGWLTGEQEINVQRACDWKYDENLSLRVADRQWRFHHHSDEQEDNFCVFVITSIFFLFFVQPKNCNRLQLLVHLVEDVASAMKTFRVIEIRLFPYWQTKRSEASF